jgi:ABC-2 type transport system permease protein
MKNLWVTFRYTIFGMRGQILGWGLGLAIYGLLIVPMYDVMGTEPGRFQQMIESYPPEFLAFFGADVNSLITPASFLKMYAFSMFPIIIGIFAVQAGSGLIVNDEERGRLDLIIAHPVGRTPFFYGRLLGLLMASVSIMFLAWLGFCLTLGSASMDLSWGQMVVPFLPLLMQMLVYASLALVLSMFLPARSLATMVSGAVMVASYFLSSLAFMDTRIQVIAKALPYDYFQTVFDFQELNLTWLAGQLGVCLVMILLTWIRFIRRDIRLSGEGSWRLPIFRRRKAIVS